MEINQEIFHNYLFCKRKFFLDVKNSISNKELDLVKYVTKELIQNENIESIPQIIKNWTIDKDLSQKELQWFLLKAPKDIINLYNKIRFEYLSFVKIYNIQKKLNHLNTTFTLEIPYIAKTNSGAYRGISFTECQVQNDIMWSPIHIEQYAFLRDLYLKDKYINGLSAKMFFIGFNNLKKSYFTFSINKNLKCKIHDFIFHRTIQDIQNQLNIPNLPCLHYKCQYYEDCHP